MQDKTIINFKSIKKYFINFFGLFLSLNFLIVAFFTSLNTKWNSDYVMLHVISKEYFKSKIFFSADNFLIKMPIYYISTLTSGFSRESFFIATFSFLSLTFLLLYIFYNKNKNKRNLNIYEFIPILYLINIGYFYNLLITSYRNFEIPLLFIIIFSLNKLNKLNIIMLISILSIIFYSDPYYFYVIGIPYLLSAIFLAFKKKIDKNQMQISISVFFSILLSYVIRFISNKSGYFYIYDEAASFVSFQQFLKNISSFFEVILSMFSANFFGKQIFSVDGIFSLINLFFIILTIYGLTVSFSKGIKKNHLFDLFISQSLIITIAAYLFSVLVLIETSRYLILVFFLSIFLLRNAIIDIKKRSNSLATIIVLLGIFVSIFNFFTISKQYFYYKPIRDEYPTNFYLIDNLIMNGVSYGFSGYWNSSVNTFLSDDRIKILQIICQSGKMTPFTWNMSTKMYNYNYVGDTFLIYPLDTNPIEGVTAIDGNFFSGCNEKNIIDQFGEPKKTLNLSAENRSWKVYIFNYNIYSKMSQDLTEIKF